MNVTEGYAQGYADGLLATRLTVPPAADYDEYRSFLRRYKEGHRRAYAWHMDYCAGYSMGIAVAVGGLSTPRHNDGAKNDER